MISLITAAATCLLLTVAFMVALTLRDAVKRGSGVARGTQWVLGLALIAIMSLPVTATTLSLTGLTTGLSYSQLVTTIDANFDLIMAGWTEFTNVNFKATPAPSEKLDGDKVNFSSCGPSGVDGCIDVLTDIDPNSSIIEAEVTNGRMVGFGPLLATEQGTVLLGTADMTVKVGAGTYHADGKIVLFAGGDSPVLAAAPSSTLQIAILALDPNGNFSDGVSTGVWIYGREHATTPGEPAVPPGLTPIVAVYTRPGCLGIENTNLGDCYIYRDYRSITVQNRQVYSTQEYFFGFDWYEEGASGATVLGDGWDSSNCPRGAALPTGHYARCSGTAASNSVLKGYTNPGVGDLSMLISPDMGGAYELEFRLKWVIEDGDVDSEWQFGLSEQDAALYTNDHIAFINDVKDSTFQYDVCNAGVCTTGAAPVGAAGGYTNSNWNVFKIAYSADTPSASFYLNGTLIETLSTNLPVNQLAPYFKADIDSGAGGDHEYLIDWVRLRAISPMNEP